MEKQITKYLLQNILEKNKIVHKTEIMKLTTIKQAHIYCKIYNLTGQVIGPLLEYYIKQKFNMIKNNASLCIGDVIHNNTNYEIKVSIGGCKNNNFNYVQLRMNHDCNYLLTAYYLNNTNIETYGELFIFKLSKNNIKKLIINYGSYAHGCISKLGKITIKDLDYVDNDKEYALRPKYNDKCWNELLQFRIDEINI
jgi:hypothetical protein